MNIVIVDGHTLNPGDLSWKGIGEFGEITLYDRTPEALVAGRCEKAEVILTNKVPISAETMRRAKDLKLICVTATGYNIVDVEAARERKVAVCNVPDYGTASVAQHTFALLLELTNGVGINSASVREGGWVRSPDFCYTHADLIELGSKTFGVVGFGKIGQQVGRIASAFGMEVLYYSPTAKDAQFARPADLGELFSQSDVISLHCPLTKDNLEFVNARLLKVAKKNAFFINTARGQLVNEIDLADALNAGALAGAALDVLSVEPPSADNPLLTARNCLITPHNAWMSREARTRMLGITAKNIEGFVAQRPSNVIV